MQILTNGIIKGAAVTIGAFDGIHIGHKKLIESAVNFAKKNNIKSCVFTFNNNPSKSKLITNNETRIKILRDLGVDILILQDFSEDFKNLSPIEFFDTYLKGAKYITVGFNFKFGKNKSGDAALIKKLATEHNITVDIAQPVKIDGITVSSSEIRKAILKGKFEFAEQMLGRPYMVEGTVQRGDQLGSTFGFPTANITAEDYMVLPKQAVYKTETFYNGKAYHSITNYGGKPTIREGLNVIETHIIDFKENIYGKKIAVRFIKKIRDIVAFPSIEELRKQLENDKKSTLN